MTHQGYSCNKHLGIALPGMIRSQEGCDLCAVVAQKAAVDCVALASVAVESTAPESARAVLRK